jgi:hypothetical protein
MLQSKYKKPTFAKKIEKFFGGVFQSMLIYTKPKLM